MPQCPLCKRNAKVEDGRCVRCKGDLSALQLSRDMPAHLYNAGLEAAKSGDSLKAILKFAAASQLDDRPEPWIVLGKLFANEGITDYAKLCFLEAEKKGAAPPVLKIVSSVNADSVMNAEAVEESRETEASATIIPVTRHRNLPSTIIGAFMFLLLGIGVGWIIHEWQGQKKVSAQTNPNTDKIVRATQNNPGIDPLSRDVTSQSGEVKQLPASTENSLAHPVVSAGPPNLYYTVRPGDTLWRIAKSHLGDGKQWHKLYEINRESITDSGHLQVGKLITMPSNVELKRVE